MSKKVQKKIIKNTPIIFFTLTFIIFNEFLLRAFIFLYSRYTTDLISNPVYNNIDRGETIEITQPDLMPYFGISSIIFDGLDQYNLILFIFVEMIIVAVFISLVLKISNTHIHFWKVCFSSFVIAILSYFTLTPTNLGNIITGMSLFYFHISILFFSTLVAIKSLLIDGKR